MLRRCSSNAQNLSSFTTPTSAISRMKLGEGIIMGEGSSFWGGEVGKNMLTHFYHKFGVDN